MKYLCVCHGAVADKPAVTAQTDYMDKKKDWSRIGLGTWKCSITMYRCKVRRVKS